MHLGREERAVLSVGSILIYAWRYLCYCREDSRHPILDSAVPLESPISGLFKDFMLQQSSQFPNRAGYGVLC